MDMPTVAFYVIVAVMLVY